jgi:LemA protein
MFPSNVMAGMFNFTKEEFFEIEDESEKAAPKVQFS